MNHSIDNSKIRVLVTDDNAVCVRVLENILKDAGYQTLTAFSGEECIKKIKQTRPDLVLLDIVMAKVNGIKVCKKVREDREISDIPIIFATADTSNKTLKEAFEAGGTDYIRKPVNTVEVLARIKSILMQREFTQQQIRNDKLAAIVEMAGAVCHEMSQPLQIILGYSELAMELISDNDSKMYKMHEKLQENIKILTDFKTKLMKITRYETRPYLDFKIIDIDKSANVAN